jgi:hypothetical protein
MPIPEAENCGGQRSDVASVSSRRKYVAPSLSRFGTLGDLTRTGGSKNGNDGQGTGCGQGGHFLFSCVQSEGVPSDRRLKEDIEEVGALFDGTPVYRFRYRGMPQTQIGLMADDVERRVPDAVVVSSDGFKRVDYKMATEASLRN